MNATPRRWEPGHYLKYADQRLRPALDLLARVPLETASRVTDLGCGAGTVTPYLLARFAKAEIVGVDSSDTMLARARADLGGVAAWVRGDAGTWTADAPQDLIFSNAALHWLDGHARLFPHLLEQLKPGGVLAVQMPNQFAEPSHAAMRAVAAQGPWSVVLAPLLRPAPVARVEQYYDWLNPLSAALDIWETTYVQVMRGDDPVLDWVAATALKPLLEALEGDMRAAFRNEVAQALARAYPKRADGATLFPFKRLFIVAAREREN